MAYSRKPTVKPKGAKPKAKTKTSKKAKASAAPKRNKSSGTKVAQMTDWDRRHLREVADQLKRRGGPAAAKELERMNKMYSKYGMSFGRLPGV